MSKYFTRFVVYITSIYLIYLLGERYLSWNVQKDSVFMFCAISILCIFIALYYFNKKNTKSIFNPVLFYTIYIFLFGYSFIPINAHHEKLDYYCVILQVITIVFFILGIFFGKKINLSSKRQHLSLSIRRCIINVVIVLSLLIFVLECASVGVIPFISMFTIDVYSLLNENAIPILHYFVQLSYIIPIWTLILYEQNVISKKQRNIYIFISLFIAFNYLSRQMWLLSFICFSFYYIFKKNISIKKVLIYGSIPVIAFLLLGALRISSIVTDGRSTLEYLNDYANVKQNANILEVYLGLYSTNNFNTFNRYIIESNFDSYMGLGVYTFRPIFTITLLNKYKIFDINYKYNSFSDLATYAVEPYLDFGLIGVVIINLIYGIVVSVVYKNYIRGYYQFIIPWSMMSFCILMAAFTNYFNTFFVWFVVIINFLIITPNKLSLSNNYYNI